MAQCSSGNVHSGTVSAESISEDQFAFLRPERNPDIAGQVEAAVASLVFCVWLQENFLEGGVLFVVRALSLLWSWTWRITE